MPGWKEAFALRTFKKEFFLSVLSFTLVLCAFTFFLAYAERRTGYRMRDVFMELFIPGDLSVLIFPLTYGAVLCGIVLTARQPPLFLTVLKTYTLLTLLRMLTLFLLPLEPPAGTIHLTDPFLQHTFYMGRPNLKDLFFSGHTATVFMFGLLVKQGIIKTVFFIAAAAVGLCVIVQHVHYSIDVLAAPFAAIISHAMEKRVYFMRGDTLRGN